MIKFREYIADYIEELKDQDGLETDQIQDYLDTRAIFDKRYIALYEEYFC